MKIYDGKNIKYQDKLAKKRRRAWVLKISFFVGLFIAVVGFILYLLFFSGFLEIKELSVNGLDKVNGDRFHDELNKRLNSKWLGLIEHQKNVLIFDSDTFKAEMFTAFPEIRQISVSKEPPHALNIDVTERETAGVWCFTDSPAGGGCKYFDKDGVTWGEAAKSSGFLILVIEDMRPDAQLNKNLLDNLTTIYEQLKKMNVFVSKFIIPKDFIGDFNAPTSGGYELMFSLDSDINKQLEVLEIFLAEKKDLPALPAQTGQAGEPEFSPQYIDLRINGRVYYK